MPDKHERAQPYPTKIKQVKLTDKHLADVYKSLVLHYTACCARGMTEPEGIRDVLGQALCCEFQIGGSLIGLNEIDRDKVFTLFYTFLDATSNPTQPSVRPNQQQHQQWFRQQSQRSNAAGNDRHYYSNQRHHLFRDLLIWNFILNTPSRRTHRRSSTMDARAILVVGAILVAAVILYYAVCCIFNTILDSVERIWHNEGWMQACFSMLGMLAGGYACATVMALTLNPVGLTLLAVAGTTIVAAALSSILTNVVLGVGISLLNRNALDANDPHRFKLTKRDIARLEAHHPELDPIKIKVAIVALREAMGTMPSPSSRFFGQGSDAQRLIKLVRELRRGGRSEVTVGNLHFDLRRYESQTPLVATGTVVDDDERADQCGVKAA
jgi:hypothetical protein